MIILINKQRAVLKKGTSFDFISENHYFTGADSYTLSITFPIKGCAENIAIFGHIYRKDFNFDTELLDCEIHDQDFHKYGSVSIVSVSDSEVKTQFLEGRSASNYHSSLDDIYINELSMPSLHDQAHWQASHYLRPYAEQMRDGNYLGYVCPPWVNNTSGNIQNPMGAYGSIYYYQGGDPSYDPPIVGFPFLIEVIKQVLSRSGYHYDLSAIENSGFSNLIICQAFPYVWHMPYMNQILPHWTVSEFLEQLELFLNGTFEIDHKAREVSHSVEIAKEEDIKDSYVEQKNIAYQDCEHQMWKFYSCDWATYTLPIYPYENIAAMRNALGSLLECAGPYNAWQYRYIHYCRQEDTMFVLKCVGTATIGDVIHHYMRIQPVNMFRPRVFNGNENADVVELGIVPACIDHTDSTNGDMIFVECGTLGDDEEDAEDRDENQTQSVNTLISGEKEKKEEYFDKIHVAFWDGTYLKYHPLMPHPYIDRHEIKPDNSYTYNLYSMRLTGKEMASARTRHFYVNQQHKFTFSFLSDTVPDVHSIFLIHGKKYLAEKITATFSAETGRSRVLKIVCYQMFTLT